MMQALRSKILIVIAILLCGVAKAGAAERDSLVVSLLTCSPGAAIYELCGHSAVRIRDARGGTQGMDSVWNYGLFDFTQPNFVYRFVKGQTDYMVGGYPTAWFLPEYAAAGRGVTEQELNLTQEEAHRMRSLLRKESLPENRVYRYNYVKDNCATRITQRLTDATGEYIVFPDTIGYGTFREEMRAFHRNYPWYQFGIDLALGPGLDYAVRPNEEMFVPVVMAERYAGAHFPDGRPLVRATRQLLPDSGHATLEATPWYLTPVTVCSLAFIMVAGICVWMGIKHRILRWLYCLWFAIMGLTGCVVAFLVFASSHEATSPNLLILWLNPLQLIFAAAVWWRRTQVMATAMAWYNIIVLTLLLIAWPMQAQSANPAFFPLLGATEALAIAYAIIAHSKSYNKDRKYQKATRHAQVSSHGAGGTRRTVGNGGSRGRKTPARGGNRG